MAASSSGGGGGGVAAAPSSVASKCYNAECKELRPDRPRKGWRLRAGDFADLCDRCGSIYEEGKFCEIFHPNASGWRCCESCGKRVHCGCIVSSQAFVLLDPGGIECISCARKNFTLTTGAAWPPVIYHTPLSDRLKEHPAKGWNQLAGSGPVPWRQAPTIFNTSVTRPELQQRASPPFEVDSTKVGDRRILSLDGKRVEDYSERFMNGIIKLGAAEKFENGSAGHNIEERLNQCRINPQQFASIKEEPSNSAFGLTVPYSSGNELNGHGGPHFRPAPPPTLAKHFYGSMLNDTNSSGDGQIRNGRPRADARGRNNLLPRYWPRITHQELQQISGDSNSVITPLFEKMLSASDAGKIGRLVLPKKCAEAYFPAISQPEGLPLKVQDAKGSEWVFQFRFWPNNNSRMYVLEGVTPCIQSMQLQAGDIVTFSRLEPQGKLIMGFRKASTAPPSDQDNEATKMSNGPSVPESELADPSSWSKVDKSGYIAKETHGIKSTVPRKRKTNVLALKSKRLRGDNEELIELKITWEEAQGLLRPPPDHQPTIVVIEGFEFEEYEDAPVLGKPTISVANGPGVSRKFQWVQCEDCSKWRKIPFDALLPARWTCAANEWDSERSSCTSPQELTAEELEDLLHTSTSGSKKKPPKQESDSAEALEALANLAILGEGEPVPSSSSSQATTKHPRHKLGCTCIVCIQPPSGKGPKHKPTCTCNVCMTVKRRFRTILMKREKKQTEKEAEESSSKKQQPPLQQPEEKPREDEPPTQCNNSNNDASCSAIGGSVTGSPSQKEEEKEGCSDEDPREAKASDSPFKGQFDLNIQPEKEEEVSPGTDPSSMTKLLQDSTDKYIKQRLGPRLDQDMEENPSNGVLVKTDQNEAGDDKSVTSQASQSNSSNK
ncbi:hypothetical protein MLD38_036970 [Melastoma candidum]|uniref:Uncharacterized protein n=1 Tax=Melastoma candidum TaxID=119954 RepID=A0ACB9LLV5_9MYRT|nr:hypothetical protein MLD38_036970 [Melastoma candidum]